MDLKEALTAASLGANICLKGIPELSKLPKGTLLKFPSGAELIVEEYNPPCQDMSQELASFHTDSDGTQISNTAFSLAAKLNRGVVGVVDVPGIIKQGDEITVAIYETPKWLDR